MSQVYKFEQYFATRRLTDAAPTPDGDHLLFVSDISGQFNLWRVPTAGGWPEQLTLFDRESVRALAVSKDGRKIAFLADRDGNEMMQVYLLDAEGGWPEQITDRPDVQHVISGGAFSPDGRYLAFAGNASDPSYVDVYLYDITTRETRRLSQGGHQFFPAGFSPDGTKLLVQDAISNTDGNIWAFDVATGDGQNLTDHPGRQAKYYPATWKKDGSGFYYRTDDGREFLAVRFFDLASGSSRAVVEANWDVEGIALSPDQSTVAYTINEAGSSRLHLVDVATGAPRALPALPPGVISLVKFAGQDAGRRLFLLSANAGQANACQVIDLEQRVVRTLTPSMLGNIPADSFIHPELVEIATHDGLKVPAWLYKPAGLKSGEKVPAVLSIHGGPEDQERPRYNYGGFYQYLLSQGVAILAPNIRGSTGFGASYQKRIHRDWGGAELKDIEACTRYLAAIDFVDATRLAVWGGSFGGYATLSAATRLPDYWKCAVDFCGPSNLVTFVKSVPPHWKPVMKSWVGDAEEDFDLLMERSPITYVENLKCDLMVVQGANDPRVVKAESDQMVERLRAMGRNVEYLLFDDEGHGFAKRINQLKGYKTMADYLIKHLKG